MKFSFFFQDSKYLYHLESLNAVLYLSGHNWTEFLVDFKMGESLGLGKKSSGPETDTETWSWFRLPIPKPGFGCTLLPSNGKYDREIFFHMYILCISVRPKPGFGIGNRNQDQVSVSVSGPELFLPKPKLSPILKIYQKIISVMTWKIKSSI